MKTIRCIVACINSNGEPDLFFVKVKGTEEQINNGEHYTTAKEAADAEGYDPVLTYDEECAAGRAMLALFEWDTASTIEIRDFDA
jgi:hypothetical protein